MRAIQILAVLAMALILGFHMAPDVTFLAALIAVKLFFPVLILYFCIRAVISLHCGVRDLKKAVADMQAK